MTDRLRPLRGRKPESPDEWQQAVDEASALITVETTRLAGGIFGGPAVDVEWCRDILRRGWARFVYPRSTALATYLRTRKRTP